MASRSDRQATRASGEFTPHDNTLPPPLPCNDHERRIEGHSAKIRALEDSIDATLDKLAAAERRLNNGDVTFAEVRKDIHALTASVAGLTGTIRWVGGMVIAAVIAAVMSGVLVRHA
jgi:hypothetical protein